MGGIARGDMFRLRRLIGAIRGVGGIGCSFLCYHYYCCCCYWFSHYYHQSPQTTPPAFIKSPLKNTYQRYQNNSSITNPYHAIILPDIYIIYTRNFYVVWVCSSILYRLRFSLLIIAIFFMYKDTFLRNC